VETDVFAQRYALVVVHATIGLDWIRIVFSGCLSVSVYACVCVKHSVSNLLSGSSFRH